MQHEKICTTHGQLSQENIIVESNKSAKRGYTLRCRLCKHRNDKKWTSENIETIIASATKWKKENREQYNAWNREDRKKDPEKYKRYEENYIKKHGREKMRKMEVARIHGLTVQQYDEMFVKQNNACLICGREEQRISRTGEKMPLCVDHCHHCESKGDRVIRGLLCHDCNTGIGKFQDDVILMKKAITYLESHAHVT